MKLRKFIFRLLLPLIQLGMAVLFFGGIFATIAESPNPFDLFFYPVFYPAIYLLDLLPPWSQDLGGLWSLVVAALLNLVIYFVIGCALDYMMNRLKT